MICKNSNVHPGDFCHRSCAASQVLGKAHMFNKRNKCWKVELVNGGNIAYDRMSSCETATFAKQALIGRFDFEDTVTSNKSSQIESDEGLDFVKKRGRRDPWNGKTVVKESIGTTEAGLKLNHNFSTLNVNIELTLPSCDYGCPRLDQKRFSLLMKSDDYPEETSWELEDICTGNVIAEGNSDGMEHLCLNPGAKYKLTVKDSEGDGMCCSWGNGEYKAYFDGQLVKTGGTFGSEESTILGETCQQ